MKTSERRHWRRSGVFIVNFEHISYFFHSVSIVDFEQVNNLSWEDVTTSESKVGVFSKLLTIFAKSFIIDVLQALKCLLNHVQS